MQHVLLSFEGCEQGKKEAASKGEQGAPEPRAGSEGGGRRVPWCRWVEGAGCPAAAGLPLICNTPVALLGKLAAATAGQRAPARRATCAAATDCLAAAAGAHPVLCRLPSRDRSLPMSGRGCRDESGRKRREAWRRDKRARKCRLDRGKARERCADTRGGGRTRNRHRG